MSDIDMVLNIDGDACEAENHRAVWDEGYSYGQRDWDRFGYSRGRKHGVLCALLVVLGLAVVARVIGRRG